MVLAAQLIRYLTRCTAKRIDGIDDILRITTAIVQTTNTGSTLSGQ